MANVKGAKINSQLAFVREQYGEAVAKNVIESMSAPDQTALKIVLDTAWYPSELHERLMRTVCKVAARGDESVYSQIGRYSAQQAYTTTYKSFRGKNIVDLFKNMVPLHGLRNDPSEIQILAAQQGECKLRITKPRSTVEGCKATQAFFARSVELLGGTDVQIREPSCSGKGGAYCQYELTWKGV